MSNVQYKTITGLSELDVKTKARQMGLTFFCVRRLRGGMWEATVEIKKGR